ncbi:MarR family transcriptional regulator [Kribbella qitaiheensis]|uniref:MarR family transcriptional regulator n=1 Tax=Kribbella qitaiheensis TaxID=1544730 RepID=A0A7G6X772_9ACTN|nr:MarR family transcriptional regulator [Kribbella qitaiheensis]QNE22087.1 MarR family transcriptional regulator [Kribbella qitaiheensis]
MKSESEETGLLLLELQRATHATLQELTSKLVDLDLSAAEINALGNLSDDRARTVSELGAAIGIRPTTLTGVLDRLERRGLLTRGTRAGDRRVVLIELTADGRETASLIAETIAEIEHRTLAGLPKEALSGFRQVLAALAGSDE